MSALMFENVSCQCSGEDFDISDGLPFKAMVLYG